MHNTLPYNILATIHDLGLTIDTFSLNKEVNGFLYRKEHIVINKNISWYEKRFAACHELAHKLLGHSFEDKIFEKEADEEAFKMLVSDQELLSWFDHYEGDTLMIEKEIGISHHRIQKRILEIYK